VGVDELPASLRGQIGAQDGHVELRTDSQVSTLHDLIEWSLARGVDLPDLEVSRPSLEEIYLELTAQETPR
jgi:ABC-2 type transport system ATP-binding protein